VEATVVVKVMVVAIEAVVEGTAETEAEAVVVGTRRTNPSDHPWTP
jgi:hypothetical protein